MSDARALTVVTGGTRGLGLAISQRLSAAGSRVVALFRDDRKAAAALTAWWHERGLTGSIEQCDLGDERQVAEVFARIVHEDGGIGSLIHNAAPPFQPTAERRLRWEDYENQLGGLKGAVLATRQVLPSMLERGGGNLVFVLSSALQQNVPAGFSHYATAKAALQGYARSLAGEYSARGLRVHCVAPGLMDTAMTAAWPDPLRLWAFGEARENLVATERVAAVICSLVEGGAAASRDPALRVVDREVEEPRR